MGYLYPFLGAWDTRDFLREGGEGCSANEFHVAGSTCGGGFMRNYDKPVLTNLSMATKESMANAFDDAFNSTLEGVGSENIFSYDMTSMFQAGGLGE